MLQTVRWPLLLSVLLLITCGSAAGMQCMPLVLCPAVLRDPASYLVGTRAACDLADRSQGVQCPTEQGREDGTEQDRTQGYYGGGYGR